MKEKKVGTRCCLDPLYSLGSKFNLTFMKVATFSLGLGLSPNLKPNVVTAIFFSSFSIFTLFLCFLFFRHSLLFYFLKLLLLLLLLFTFFFLSLLIFLLV
jgi:hypothetical protein